MRKPIKRKPSKLAVIDIPLEDLIPDEDNPNQMKEATFDLLVEEIREQGFDEPILVRPHPKQKGKYQIGSGHHRVKAAMVLGYTALPAIVKKWTNRQQKVALVKRNSLHGDMDKRKLTKLYMGLMKDGKDAIQVQRELGFTERKTFEAMIEQAEKNLPPAQRKKLQDAKETIKSVDDLSSVLNKIFKEAGSDLDEGYMVFSFGGKKHHYFQIDDTTNKKLIAILEHCETHKLNYIEFMQSIIANVDVATQVTATKRKRPLKRKKRK